MGSKLKRVALVATMMTSPLAFAAPAFGQAPAVARSEAPSSPVAGPQVAGTPEANGGLNEIIVTATKTGAQNLQRTAAAVSVVDRKLLQAQGLNTVQDIASYVPNLTFSRNTAAALIYIRGIGSSNAGAGSDPSVTQQVDGVYIARASGQLTDFFDVDRIEVLRGPQGTLYGRNAVGGTINVISRQPSANFGGEVRVGYGNYNNQTVDGYLTGPLAGKTLTASIAANYRDHDAFFHNVVPGFHDVGSAHRYGVRGQLRFAPSSAFDYTVRADYSYVNEYFESYDHLRRPVAFNAPLANALVGSYRDIAINVDQKIKNNLGGVSGEGNWRLGGGFALKSITAWRQTKVDLTNDNDATDIFVQHANTRENDRQFSQEFNLNYQANRIRAVAGLYYFGDTDMQVNNALVPPSIATPPQRSQNAIASPTVKTKSYAAFAQANYEIVPSVTLIAGARYTTERKAIDQSFFRRSLNPATPGVSLPGFPAIFMVKRHDKAFTPKLGVDFQATRDVFLYASVTRGFKSGGFNNAGTAPATIGFEPEKLTAYEAGAKTQFFDRKLRINVTGFSYDYSGLQVRQFLSVGNAVITNAASAKVNGLEFEVLARPIRDVTLTANTSFLDAHYKNFPNASIPGGFAAYTPNQMCVAGVCTINASGNSLDNAPKRSGILAVDYTPHVGAYGLNVHLDYAWRTRAFYDPSNISLASQKGYGLWNANIGFGPATGWRLEAYAKNITNKKYYVIVAGNGLTPGAIVGDPQTYGVRASFRW